jgi:type II secretion system protein H
VLRLRLSSGFTLIELLVVLVIISLIAAAAVLSSTGMWRQASIEASIVRLESLDQHMRSFARSRGTGCELEFDTYEQHVRKVYHSEAQAQHAATRLGRGLNLKQVHLPGVSATRRKVTVPFGMSGVSPTYALEFDTSGGKRCWIMFAGVSGQLPRFDTERELDEAFELIRP